MMAKMGGQREKLGASGGRDGRWVTPKVGGGSPLEVSRLGTPDSDFSWNWRLQLQLDLQTPTANRTGWLDELDDWR